MRMWIAVAVMLTAGMQNAAAQEWRPVEGVNDSRTLIEIDESSVASRDGQTRAWVRMTVSPARAVEGRAWSSVVMRLAMRCDRKEVAVLAGTYFAGPRATGGQVHSAQETAAPSFVEPLPGTYLDRALAHGCALDARRQAMEQHFARIAAAHPDWQETVRSEAYIAWIRSLPEDARKEVVRVIVEGSASDVIGVLDRFKARR